MRGRLFVVERDLEREGAAGLFEIGCSGDLVQSEKWIRNVNDINQ